MKDANEIRKPKIKIMFDVFDFRNKIIRSSLHYKKKNYIATVIY